MRESEGFLSQRGGGRLFIFPQQSSEILGAAKPKRDVIRARREMFGSPFWQGVTPNPSFLGHSTSDGLRRAIAVYTSIWSIHRRSSVWKSVCTAKKLHFVRTASSFLCVSGLI